MPEVSNSNTTPSWGVRYKTAVTAFCARLNDNDYQILARVLGVLLLDLHRAFKIGMRSIVGAMDKTFRVRGLNPTKLSKEDLKKVPTLLINGNAHNQGVWIPMAKMLADQKVGPLFTVNFPAGMELTHEHMLVIDKKALKIRDLYRDSGFKGEFKINLVGYSFSGLATLKYGQTVNREKEEALKTSTKDPDSVELKSLISTNKIINLGHALTEESLLQFFTGSKNHEFLSKFYEITGAFDALDYEKSLLNSSHKADVATTHLGLPSSEETAAKIAEWLKEDTPVSEKKKRRKRRHTKTNRSLNRSSTWPTTDSGSSTSRKARKRRSSASSTSSFESSSPSNP